MFTNYLKIAFRSLTRNSVHAAINILGLSLAIAACILIVLFVRDELTFDTFHSKADRIYRVYAREDWGENQQFFATTTPFPMGPTLKEHFPEVETQVRITGVGAQVKLGNQILNESVAIGGQDFFDVFDFELIAGDRFTALRNQNSIVITESMATKYFGTGNPIEKTMSLQLGSAFEDFVVTGVLADLPTNSSIRFGMMIPDLYFPKLYNERILTTAWFNIGPETYVLLRDGVDPKTVEAKFPSVFQTILGEKRYAESKYAPGLQPLTTIHLDTSYPAGRSDISDPKYSYILSAIALLILFVACINFVTLSIGRSLRRAKEVGVRKVVGAQRRQLVMQFLGEAVIVTVLSATIGFALAAMGLPLFNELSGKQLLFPFDGFMALVVAGMIFIIGLIAGSYPAFVLSAFKPVATLKGSIGLGAGNLNIRKVLVGIQLVLSIFLVSSTLVMRQQFDFMQRKNLGFKKDELAVIPLVVPRKGGGLKEQIVNGFDKAELFKTELIKIPGIKGICRSSHDFGRGEWVNAGYTDDGGTYRTFNFNTVDDEYIPVMGMDITQGRNFSDANPSDARRALIVNEAFAREMGWSDAVGKRIPGKAFPDHEVIGVVRDFNYSSLYKKVEPLILTENPEIIWQGIENVDSDNSPIPKLIVRLQAGEMMATIDEIKSTWATLSGGEEFSFAFVDESLDNQYRKDQNLGRIVTIATILAMIIGGLGLYGLASLAMQNRTKEISVRKVLGATEGSLLVLLSRDYMLLTAVCFVISIPATYYLMERWLSIFEYRITIGWEAFALAGGIALLLASLTIGYETLKTAWTQPAKTLKYE